MNLASVRICRAQSYFSIRVDSGIIPLFSVSIDCLSVSHSASFQFFDSTSLVSTSWRSSFEMYALRVVISGVLHTVTLAGKSEGIL